MAATSDAESSTLKDALSDIRLRAPLYDESLEMIIELERQRAELQSRSSYICVAGVSFGERLGKGMERSADCCSSRGMKRRM